jgi:hypothetical protein
MSKNSIKVFYRNICKDVSLENRNLYRSFINDQICKFKNEFKDTDINSAKYIERINLFDNLIENHIRMKYHIERENTLLKSYNINVARDTKKEIENVAKRVGLKII